MLKGKCRFFFKNIKKVISVRAKKINFGYKLLSENKGKAQIPISKNNHNPPAFGDDLSGLIKRLRNLFNSLIPEADCQIVLNYEDNFVKSLNLNCACLSNPNDNDNIIPLKYNRSVIAHMYISDKEILSAKNQAQVNMLADLYGFLIYHHLIEHQTCLDSYHLNKSPFAHTTADNLAPGSYHQDKIRALQQLSGGLAHELNNHLCGILGSAEYALKNHQPAEIKFALENIIIAGEKAGAIINSLFKFSGNTLPQKSPVKLNQLLDDIIDSYRDEIVEKGIRVKKNYTSDLTISLDQVMITQAVQCLLQNALENVPAGGLLIIESRTDGNYGIIQISDSGPGISSKNLARVFEPFYSTKGILAGGKCNNHGLGLSVAYGIITAHCGDINLTLDDNDNLRFIIKLPIQPAQ